MGGPIWSDVSEGAAFTAAWLLAGAKAAVCAGDNAKRRRAERSFILGIVAEDYGTGGMVAARSDEKKRRKEGEEIER